MSTLQYMMPMHEWLALLQGLSLRATYSQGVSVCSASYLYEVDTPLVCGCSKPTHVTNDASPKSHKCGVAVQSALQCFVPDLLQHFKTLELLPVRKRDNLDIMSAS